MFGKVFQTKKLHVRGIKKPEQNKQIPYNILLRASEEKVWKKPIA